jgi:hypothetical protein
MGDILPQFFRHQRNGDLESASYSLQLISNARAETQNLAALADEVKRSETPPPVPQVSQEEKAAKPWDKCTWEDTYEWASKSKMGVDPESFKRGMAEVMARRQRGE